MSKCRRILCSLLLAVAWPALSVAGIVDCMPRRFVDVRVRVGDDPAPMVLQLSGGSSPALRLTDPLTGALRWSAAAAAPALQTFPDMRAAFAGSLAVVDLDGDGLHDRLYAGDLGGRLWRFDIHQGAPPEALMTGGVFASLGGVPVVRAFLAPPDVSLSTVEGNSWINVAIGTASLWQGQERNRFYVLRDHAPFEVWSAKDYGRWRPLTESDLAWTNDPAREAAAAPLPQAGFFVTLEHGSVVLPSITVSGRTFMAVAEDFSGAGAGAGAACSIAVTVSSLSLEDGQLLPVADRGHGDDSPMKLPVPLTTDTRFRITAAPGASSATCRLGDSEIQDCAISMRPAPLWWRREDAD